MYGFTTNNRGRYQCDFCSHNSYKIWGAAKSHVERFHAHELEVAKLKREIKILKEKKTDALQPRVIYRDPPKPKYWYIKNGGGIYCETCKTVQMDVGIPVGQTIESTPHDCGNKTLKLVLRVL